MLGLVSALGTEELMTYLIVLFAISIAFWRLGSPAGSSLCRSEIALITSGGFPEKFNTVASILSPPNEADDRKYSQTRHFTESLPDSRSHADDPDLTKGVLVEPLVHELARVLEAQVESGRTHVSVHH